MFVGLVTRDLHTSIYCTSELSEECLRTFGPGMGFQKNWGYIQVDACNRGAAAEADAIGE